MINIKYHIFNDFAMFMLKDMKSLFSYLIIVQRK